MLDIDATQFTRRLKKQQLQSILHLPLYLFHHTARRHSRLLSKTLLINITVMSMEEERKIAPAQHPAKVPSAKTQEGEINEWEGEEKTRRAIC